MSRDEAPGPRCLAVGDAALCVELGTAIDPVLAARVRALERALAERPFAGLREAVPSYRSLLVVFDPLAVSRADVEGEVHARLASLRPGAPAGRRHVVPVRYGGEDGPDLAELARARGLGETELAALHAGRDYTALMLGFVPGFAYLGSIDPRLAVPRRATPRPRVPAGSVGIAGTQTAIYPAATPGGWSLIGRTSLRLFDPHAEPPALILPGDQVRFETVGELPSPAPLAPPPAAEGEPGLEVVAGGLLSSVQDLGRFGHRRLGIGWAGALDGPALRWANALVGNPAEAAGIECTITGPTLRVLRPLALALAGADLGAVLHRPDLGAWPVPLGVRVLARPGNVVAFTGRRGGCRAYLAVAGGVAVPPVLGSRATDLGAGFGGLHGRALREGDVIRVGTPANRESDGSTAPATADGEPITLRVVPGPQAEYLTPEAQAAFFEATWSVAATSDRVGCRLLGPRLRHAGAAEIVSDGMLPGCIQVPPDGQPIAMLADAPTTGGYPKLATIVSGDLSLLAQALPGAGRVRFERC